MTSEIFIFRLLQKVLLTVFTLGILSASAQDKIFLVNGNEVEVIVVKVDKDFILSKSMNPADEHIYKYPKTEVVRIEYADGHTEHFDDRPPVEKPQEEEFVDKEVEQTLPGKPERPKPIKKKERLFYVGLGSGLDLPLGRYGLSSGYDHGYAKTGGFLNFETSVLFSSIFGMSLTIGYANNQIRSSAVEKKWELPTVSNYESSVSSYNHTYLLIGPYFSLKTEKNLYVDIKLKYGISYTPEPSYTFSFVDTAGLTVKYDNHNDTLGSTWRSISPISFSVGFAIRYNLNKKWGIMLQYDWLVIPMYFNSTQNMRQYDGTRLVSETRTNMELYEIASINNLGLGIYFMLAGPK